MSIALFFMAGVFVGWGFGAIASREGVAPKWIPTFSAFMSAVCSTVAFLLYK